MIFPTTYKNIKIYYAQENIFDICLNLYKLIYLIFNTIIHDELFILIFRYGLIVPKKKLESVRKINNVFGDDSESENEAVPKPIEVCIIHLI